MTRKYTTLPYTEYPVATGNYGESGRLPITQIIIHSTVGTYEGAIAYFNNPNAGTSAHYVVANNGRLAAMLEEYYVAYHSGNLETNRRTIGIEHEWYQGMVITDILYKKSAQLVADICKFYGIACNRGTVKGHNEVVATGCPNRIDVDRIVREAQALLNPQPVESIESLKKQIADLKETEKRLITEKDEAIARLEKESLDKLALAEQRCLIRIKDEKNIFRQKIISFTQSQ